MTALLEVDSISKKIHNKVLIENVSFKLNKGEITTLIGQNGAGKTTLAKIILGQESYDSGSLFIQKGTKIGYVPQKLDFGFNLPIRSRELLKILSPKSSDNNIIEFKQFVNYEQIKNKDISAISGGELQKLLLVGTLLNKPDLLILDEPTQFLDVNSQKQFYHILKQAKDELNVTIFMISHDLFTVMKNSDQVICLNKHVCCSGKPSELEINSGFREALSEIGLYLHNHDHSH
jgi:zinc transport system ATP-binding protein